MTWKLLTILALMLQVVPQGPLQLLDLTEKTHQSSLGPPGFSRSGSTGPLIKGKSAFQLPLNIRVTKARIDQHGNLIAEVTVSNAGTVPFRLPISQDQVKVQGSGSSDRLVLAFSVAKARTRGEVDPKDRRPVSILFASDAFSTSYYILPVGASVVLRLAANGGSLGVSGGDKVRFYCDGYKLEDQRNFIAQWSELVSGAGVVSVLPSSVSGIDPY